MQYSNATEAQFAALHRVYFGQLKNINFFRMAQITVLGIERRPESDDQRSTLKSILKNSSRNYYL